jgi:PKHD-type hydroxylase
MQYRIRALSSVPKKKLKNDAFARLQHNDHLVLPRAVPKLFTAEECDNILRYSETLTDQPGAVGQVGVTALRDSQVKWLFPSQENEWVFARLDKLVKDVSNYYQYELAGFFQGAQVATYSGGGHYGWHIDIGKGVQSTRKLSISVQLSDSSEYEGGDLEFMCIEQKASRQRGDAVVFPAFLVHRVTPVTQGARQSMVSWIGGQPFR